MFKTLRTAWKIADLRKKILYTLLMLLVFRLGSFVPVPGVNVDYITTVVEGNGLLGLLNTLSGGSLGNLTIFAMGIVPYINASIIMNLLTVAIPPLERMAKEGSDGQKKIASITRYVAVGLGLFQAVAILIGMGEDAFLQNNWFNYITVVLCLTAGTALVMWIGERINEKGVGNGISLLIFIGIVSRLPLSVVELWNNATAGNISVWAVVAVVVFAVLIIGAITFIDLGERRIPVQYAKRVVGRKMYGGQSTHIPMKINQAGVLPIIFALTLLQVPAIISSFWPESGFYQWWSQNMMSGGWAYNLIYAVLILFFTYFYAQISFNPIDVSKNLQQYGGFIPGIRPGKPTSDYLAKILSRITLFGAIFLALVATVPTVIMGALGMTNLAFGATSLLIMVSVSLETTRQIESQMMMRHYKGFLK